MKLFRLTNSSEIQQLVSQHKKLLQAAFASSIHLSKAEKTKSLIFPLVQTTKPNDSVQPRPPKTAGVCYPAISPSLTQSSKVSKTTSGKIPPLCRMQLPPSDDTNSLDSSYFSLVERQANLNKIYEQFETCNRKLQEMFTMSTQRVLVPLQTFCKHTRKRYGEFNMPTSLKLLKHNYSKQRCNLF